MKQVLREKFFWKCMVAGFVVVFLLGVGLLWILTTFSTAGIGIILWVALAICAGVYIYCDRTIKP